ncbi:hypothetical protein HUJ04_004277 [Dendroctonus ponderosae]|nr:hypothetical protein HUJ04_004277 [Dendroctonus ponderosae]
MPAVIQAGGRSWSHSNLRPPASIRLRSQIFRLQHLGRILGAFQLPGRKNETGRILWISESHTYYYVAVKHRQPFHGRRQRVPAMLRDYSQVWYPFRNPYSVLRCYKSRMQMGRNGMDSTISKRRNLDSSILAPSIALLRNEVLPDI